MSEIKNIIENLAGTREADILERMEKTYINISEKQAVWYDKSKVLCPEGCGECCRNFVPDLLEGEALYMAAWLIENKPELADLVENGDFPFPENTGCKFWDENKEYHCTIYGGRPSICRLFGACGNRGKNGDVVLKPCKFFPAEKLALLQPPLEHRQYSQQEIQNMYEVLPPAMGDLMEQAISITPDNLKTNFIHEILPVTIKRLKWILSLNRTC